MNIAIKPENISSREALVGKVSLVTGSTSGIGLGIARALAAAGSEIVLNGFGKPDEVADVQAKITSDFKVRVSYSPADMSKPAAIREMIENTLKRSHARTRGRDRISSMQPCNPPAGSTFS
jgi:3-hydroxybutyrate dehydrogenase